MSTNILAGHDSENGGIPCNEEVGLLIFAYGFWLGLTALAVVGLGRLKRWLMKLAEKRNRLKKGG